MGGIGALRRLLAGMITFTVADETSSHVRKCLGGSSVDECRAVATAAGLTKVGRTVERVRFFGAIPQEVWRHPTEPLFLDITGLTYSFVTCLEDRHIFTWGHAAPAMKNSREGRLGRFGGLVRAEPPRPPRARARGRTPARRHETLEDRLAHARAYCAERVSLPALAKLALQLPAMLVGMPIVALFVLFAMLPGAGVRELWGMTASLSLFSVFQLLCSDSMVRSAAWRATPLVVTESRAEPASPLVASDARLLVENAFALAFRAGPAILGALAVIGGVSVVSEVALSQLLPGNTIAPLVPSTRRSRGRRSSRSSASRVPSSGRRRCASVSSARSARPGRSCSCSSPRSSRSCRPGVFAGTRSGPGGFAAVVCLLPQLTMAHTQSQFGWIVGRVTGKTGRREIVEETNRLLKGKAKLYWGITLIAMFLWASALLPRFGLVPSLGFVGTVVPIYYFVGLVLFAVGGVTAALAAGLVGLAKGIDLHAEPEVAVGLDSPLPLRLTP